MKPKKYKIETIRDIANVINEKNIDNFLEGFSFSLRKYLKTVDWAKKCLRLHSLPSKKKMIKNTDYFNFLSFEYIDDAKQKNEIKITLKK